MDDVRVLRAERRQPSFELVDLESLVVEDHPARAVWAFVEGLDLQPLYDRIKARGDAPGRPAADPRVLLALWLYATVDGVGAARALDRLCAQHAVYRWLCGGVGVNRTMLSAFRADSGAFLDDLLTRSLAGLLAQGLVTLDEAITDGTKVRAAASRSSMRSAGRLAELEAQARARVETLRGELGADPGSSERRRLRRQLAGAQDRARRVAAAHESARRLGAARTQEAEADRAETDRAEADRAEADRASVEAAGDGAPGADGVSESRIRKRVVRVSTTDPDARLMRMADGATRAAYNVQVTTARGFIVAIEPTDRGNDRGLAPAMVEQAQRRCGRAPDRLLADVGAMTAPDIVSFARTHPAMTVFSPPPARKPNAKPESQARYERNRAAEPPCLKAWRMRMDSPPGQAIYKRRSDTEHAHARMKNRGFGRMLVRGLQKVRAACLMHAIAHNLIWATSRAAAPAAA